MKPDYLNEIQERRLTILAPRGHNLWTIEQIKDYGSTRWRWWGKTLMEALDAALTQKPNETIP